jgi:hypothetical protein
MKVTPAWQAQPEGFDLLIDSYSERLSINPTKKAAVVLVNGVPTLAICCNVNIEISGSLLLTVNSIENEHFVYSLFLTKFELPPRLIF